MVKMCKGLCDVLRCPHGGLPCCDSDTMLPHQQVSQSSRTGAASLSVHGMTRRDHTRITPAPISFIAASHDGWGCRYTHMVPVWPLHGASTLRGGSLAIENNGLASRSEMAVRREGDQLTRNAERYTRPCLWSRTKASLTPAAQEL